MGEEFWLATIISTTVFGWGAAFGHIRDMMVNNNYAPGNAGAPMYMDIIAPAVFILLFVSYKMTKKRKAVPVKANAKVKTKKKAKSRAKKK